MPGGFRTHVVSGREDYRFRDNALPCLFALLLVCLWSIVGPAQATAQQIQSETDVSAEVNGLEIENASAEFDLLRPKSPAWLDWSEAIELAAAEELPSVLPSIDPPPDLSTASNVNAALLRTIPADAPAPLVSNALGTDIDVQQNPVRRIPTVVEKLASSNRVVRYEIPLDDLQVHQAFAAQGIPGRLVDGPVAVAFEDESTVNRVGARLQRFFSRRPPSNQTRLVRYDVPAENIALHAEFSEFDGQILEPGMLRLPEVRFFQPKARVFMDMKRRNDGEFDLFSNGAILASLDVVELYFPMPLISERFARAVGKTNRLSQLGWRVGGTVGLGITTALNNGDSSSGSAPISTFSSGVRYEFPLGRPSNEVITTGDPRLDQRTRVGIETGFQAGVSTDESLADSSDMGWYFGILVNTPWNNN